LHKKKVLTLDLKMSNVSAFLIMSGSEFHNMGAATEKEQPPYILRLCLGTVNRLLDEERNVREGLYLTISSQI
jgi:hypothetical protein